MRLLIATPLYPPEPGGPATYAKLLEEELPKLGVDVTLVKFSEVRGYPKIIRHFLYGRRVLKEARTCDAVLALDPTSTGYPAMLAAKKAGKPFFVKVVGDYAWEQGKQRFGVTMTLDEFVKTRHVPPAVQFFRKRQSEVAQAAVRVIVPSNYLKRIVACWGVRDEKIVVIYNAVTLDGGGAAYPAVDALSHPRIVTSARLVPWKGIDGLIDAVARVREKGVAASLLVIGDGPERARLEARAREKLSKDFFFLGAVSHADALRAMRSADVFVLNTSYEGLSHVLIEAMLLGLPIVTTPVGGNTELTHEGVDALWVEPGNDGQLADAIMRLASDTGFAKRLGDNAQAVAAQFSPSVLATQLKNILFP